MFKDYLGRKSPYCIARYISKGGVLFVDHSNYSDEHGRQVGKVVCVDAGCLEVRMIWETDYVKCFRG